MIDRVPTIDTKDETGLKPENLRGNVKFCDVKFKYPARQEQTVLSGVSFEAEEDKTTALCGQFRDFHKKCVI